MRGVDPALHVRLRWGIVVAVAIVALIAWLVVRGGRSGSSAHNSQVLSKSELREAAAGFGSPLYWAGPALNAEYELVNVANGGHQLRYVPAGEHSEAASARALTVGSYPLADAAAAIRAVARQPWAVIRHGAGGREVVSSRRNPGSVYFASPDNSVEVEVYAPSPQRAMRLALSGRIRPVR